MNAWRKVLLGSVVTFQRGYDLPYRDRRHGTFPVVTSAGITDFHFKPMVDPPGVVTGRYGTIGGLFFIDQPFWPLNTTLYVRSFHGNDPRFIYFLLQQFDFESFSGKSGVPGVNRNDLHKEPVWIPESVAEQTKIANALSDVELLLNELSLIIEKKHQIKQAAMQELLTGKRRLPGFEGEWDVRELGSLGTWRGGMTPSMQNPDYWNQGDFPWISSGDVKISRLSDTSQHVTAHAVSSGAAVVIPAKSIVLVTRSGILRKQLPVSLLERPMAINQDIKALIPARDIDSSYLLHALTWAGSQILKSCMKTGTTVESVEFAWLKRFAIPVPSHEEQIAIAKALSDMEDELAEIEAQRTKVSALKQGMMQQLLTGKIRLT